MATSGMTENLDPYQLGGAVAWLSRSHEKQAGDTELSYAMTGKLYFSKSGYLLLSVPNALGRGVFDAMTEPGIELPTSGTTGQYNAHISVMRPDEVKQAGGADKITERGHELRYTLGPLRSCEPHGWNDVSRCWMLSVQSPALEGLRKSYGLTPKPFGNQFDFHITVAIRKKNVLRVSDLSQGVISPAHRPAEFAKAASDVLRQLATERKQIAEPTPGQAEAGNYQKGHIRLHGLDISIENGKGSTRRGTAPDGKKWECTVIHDYGYIRGTTGKDKDHVDIFIGPSPDTELVYVVDQQDPKTGRLDEHKCLVGFHDVAAAKAGYLGNYEPGWQGLQSIIAMTLPQFRWWLTNGDMQKPAAGCLLKAAGVQELPSRLLSGLQALLLRC